MKQDGRTNPSVKEGEAIFLPPERCLWEMRQAAKRAARKGREAQRFIVTHEEDYYANMLDQQLANEKELRALAVSLGGKVVGEQNGSLCCAALWDMSTWEGVLLHRKGASILCAYLPAMTVETANAEHLLAARLAALADEMQDIPVLLDRGIRAGRHDMRFLLHLLSKQMDV